ncbi:50S ribosomal protein L6 [Thalassospiraceae bacterium LMO-SO8]|jgi:large subunit ribosomal protein L6|nr:50S ribosomal protein L6 [Alphaproteobacteria bacterium LMO-S08]WND75940.1 50S ribosomal protein L6 [Thalassospiraceae bacterium LMO-SO8]|tara:strand:+ start:1588 stop:2121 length:534 start_codon:yes stop_codon:yes gene_type:complete
MSRIGKNPVLVPDGVTVEIDGMTVKAKGKLGELSETLVDDVVVTMEDNLIKFAPANDTQRARQMWGMSRTKVNNLVEGVSQGFKKQLDISGVGYRAAMQGNKLVLQLGFSHDVEYPVPAGIKIACPEQTQIVIEGIDKQLVGQVAAEIRAYRPPEPYKGKGVRYAGEFILRKEGKKK